MAVTLTKRKRCAEADARSAERKSSRKREVESDSEDDDMARALFQRAFEAKFKPLEKVEQSTAASDDEIPQVPGDEEDIESDWDGLSDDENVVEIVKHSELDVKANDEKDMGKKAFMSSKPPVIDEIFGKAPRKVAKVADSAETGTEAADLKNDLALQRLLKESHLLDPSFSAKASTPEGKGRIKALDMRLQDLGAKSSVMEQQNMPLAHRKGIAAKNATREARRRQEAAENGIILEKQKLTARTQKKRDRGIGAPGIGKFRGGMLKLSSRDVKSIEGNRGKGSTRQSRKK